MQLGKFKFILIIALIWAYSLIFTSAVYSDSQSGWKGYGLYNISGSEIEILQEDVSIEIENEKLHYNGEFAIRNITNSKIKVALGISASGVQNINMQEKGYFVKWRKRSLEGLQSEYKLEKQLPQESYWYVFNITLNPAETRIINVNADAVQQVDERGAYIISYFEDRNLGYSNNTEKSSLYIKINEFEPYNILYLKGLNPTEISQKGEIFVNSDDGNIDAVSITHKNVTEQAIDLLMKSPMRMPREIALNFKNKNYDKASALCDEYLKNPDDKDISNEQVLFIKAESLRRLYKSEKYLELAEAMDYSKLYPTELRNKIYLDRLDIYTVQKNQDKIENLSKELYLLSEDSLEFLAAWMEDSGYFDTVEAETEVLEESKSENENVGQTAEFIKKWYDKIIRIPYTPLIIFLFGLILGIFLRKPPKRRRYKYNYWK